MLSHSGGLRPAAGHSRRARGNAPDADCIGGAERAATQETPERRGTAARHDLRVRPRNGAPAGAADEVGASAACELRAQGEDVEATESEVRLQGWRAVRELKLPDPLKAFDAWNVSRAYLDSGYRREFFR